MAKYLCNFSLTYMRDLLNKVSRAKDFLKIFTFYLDISQKSIIFASKFDIKSYRKMRKSQIKIGTKVKYYPFENMESKATETIITSDPWECCGAMVCKIQGEAGGFDIKHLVKL